MQQLLLTIFLCLAVQSAYSQRQIAITIDDVPNTSLYEKDEFHSVLLTKLDSLAIPIDIFVNEGLIYRTDFVSENFDLLHQWYQRDYVTIGNHTFGHSRYSEVGFEAFKEDVLKGAYISKELCRKYEKELTYFRFPYNDLGNDSVQHQQIRTFLAEANYQIAPFTIESSDWMYNYVYEYYLENGDTINAQFIGQRYIKKTLEYVDYFEQLSQSLYQRPVNHIYLCHDNRLNADYLDLLIQELQQRAYEIISMKEALKDPIYNQSDRYYKRWGVSWIYRWLTDHKERIGYMRQEPSTKDIEGLFDQLKEE